MQKIKFIISLIGMLVMFYIMNLTGKSLITLATPYGILNLEFAYNQQKVDQIVTAWSSNPATDLINDAIINTYWDFLYLFFYGFFLFNCGKLIHHQLINNYGKLGLLFSRFAVLAAFLDCIENGFMLNVLNNTYTSTSLYLMVGASLLKWIIIACIVVYVLVGFVLMAIKKKI